VDYSSYYTYYSNLFQSNVKDARKQWQVINSIIKGGSVKCHDLILLKDDSLVCDEFEVSNMFNEYFINVPKNVASSCQNASTQDKLQCSQYFHKFYNESSFFYNPIVPAEVHKVVSSISPCKSTGDDFLSSAIMRNVAEELSPVLADLFNKSLYFGIFPEVLKVATVVPIFKKGNKNKEDNYRPISLLPVLSKILEELFRKGEKFSFFRKSSLVLGLVSALKMHFNNFLQIFTAVLTKQIVVNQQVCSWVLVKPSIQ